MVPQPGWRRHHLLRLEGLEGGGRGCGVLPAAAEGGSVARRHGSGQRSRRGRDEHLPGECQCVDYEHGPWELGVVGLGRGTSQPTNAGPSTGGASWPVDEALRSSVAFFGADGSEGTQGLQRPGGSDSPRDNTGGLAGESTAAELKDELPVGQLVTFVGALDSVGQLAQVHLRLPAGPALRRTWNSITLPRPCSWRGQWPPMNERSWRSSYDLGHYFWGAG